MRKADTAVTGDARVRCLSCLILADKNLNDARAKDLAVVKHIVRYAKFHGYLARVLHGSKRTASPCHGFQFVLSHPQPHGRADYLVACLLQQVSRYRTVNAAAHPH